MALAGSIRDFSLADIFQLIGIQRKTGVLTLKGKEEEVKVSFLNGMLVNADSRGRRLDDRLGTVLVKTGKVTQDNLKRALKLQKETLKKLGVILVEEQMLRPEDLREALGIQVTQIIYRLFRWKDGDYHFEQDSTVDYDKDNFQPMSAESILMEGMRMIDEWPIIERKIASFDMVFEKVALEGATEPMVEEGGGEDESVDGDTGDDFDRIFGGDKKAETESPASRIKLTRDESVVYQQVNGTATVQDIIDRVMLSEFDICRALFDLTNRNLIQPVAKVPKSTVAQRKAAAATSAGVSRALWVAAAVMVAAGLALSSANPLNLLAGKSLRGPGRETLRERESVARVRRVAAAVDAYAFVHHAFPASAEELIKDGILRPDDLLDPWGRPLTIAITPDQIVVSGRTGRADDSPEVTEERVFPG